jgi:20S proteasome alpha/beta subunit
MTLIVGIRCRDGVVIAADSAATLGGAGGMTISQPTQKINIIDETIVVACAGSVGMGQRFSQEVDRLWTSKGFTGTKCASDVDAGMLISAAIRPHIIAEANVAQQLRQVLPNAASGFISAAVIAMPVAKKLALIEISETGAPEIVPLAVPFVSIGSGKALADPFLGFLRRIFWPNSEPTLAEGTLAALWTLDQCIRTSYAFLAQPVHIAELRIDTGFKARRLSDEELGEHREAIRVAEQRLATFREELTTELNTGGDIPTPQQKP